MTMVNRMLERVPETNNDILAGSMKTFSDNANPLEWYYLAVQEATNTHASQNKEGMIVPGLKFEYEYWVEMMENPDWLRMEKRWIETNG